MDDATTYDVLIVGSGFGAICCAIKLKELGITNFIMLEKEQEFGGTWYLNTYPGAQVDVQSYLYSFSFEPYDWSRIFAEQEEILNYTNHLLDKYDLRKYGQTNKEVTHAKFQEATSKWHVRTSDGSTYRASIVINATGVLNTPMIPTFKGQEYFRGTAFHSSKWDHGFDLEGKRVAVIGTGASAVQVVPNIEEKVRELFVFQRTPHWIIHRPDRPFKRWERSLLTKVPLVRWLYREFLFWKNEARIFPFTSMTSIMKVFRLEGLLHLRKYIKDPELRRKLTPDFMIGCKRVLISNDYYPTLLKAHVELVTDSIEALTPNGIRTTAGDEVEVDLIVYCTGFKAADHFPYELKGLDGADIHDSWKQGGHAYLGTTIPGFPNFFIMAGPNTGIGHTSALHIAESQVNYIMDAIRQMKEKHYRSFNVKKEVEARFNRTLHKAMSKTIWQTGGCKSWYQNKAGENTTLNPYSNVRYRRMTKRFNPADYTIAN